MVPSSREVVIAVVFSLDMPSLRFLLLDAVRGEDAG